MIRLWKSTVALVCLTLAFPAYANSSWILKPGKGFGDVKRNDGLARIKQVFGAKNVKPADIHIEEGMTEKGLVIYGSDPARQIEIIWADSKARKGVRWVRLHGRKSRWKTAEGISLGTKLKKS